MRRGLWAGWLGKLSKRGRIEWPLTYAEVLEWHADTARKPASVILGMQRGVRLMVRG